MPEVAHRTEVLEPVPDRGVFRIPVISFHTRAAIVVRIEEDPETTAARKILGELGDSEATSSVLLETVKHLPLLLKAVRWIAYALDRRTVAELLELPLSRINLQTLGLDLPEKLPGTDHEFLSVVQSVMRIRLESEK